MRKVFILLAAIFLTMPLWENRSGAEEDVSHKVLMESMDNLIEIQKLMLDQMNRRFEDMNKRFEDMSGRFEDMNKRFDSIYNLILVLIGIMASGFIGMIGVIFWDRRTFLTREQERIRKLEERQKVIEEVVIELAKGDEALVNKLKASGLL